VIIQGEHRAERPRQTVGCRRRPGHFRQNAGAGLREVPIVWTRPLPRASGTGLGLAIVSNRSAPRGEVGLRSEVGKGQQRSSSRCRNNRTPGRGCPQKRQSPGQPEPTFRDQFMQRARPDLPAAADRCRISRAILLREVMPPDRVPVERPPARAAAAPPFASSSPITCRFNKHGRPAPCRPVT